MQMLRKFFEGLGEISPSNMEYLLDSSVERTLQKGDKLVIPHQKVDSVYFIEEGYLNYFSYNDFGGRTTLKIIGPNQCWTVMDSFFEQKHTLDECQAITDVNYCELKKSDYIAIKSKNIELANFMQTIFEYVLSKKVIEANKRATMSVRERYLDLLDTNSQMVQQVPVNILASYIGTSRETLHRIRRRLSAA